MFIPTVYTPGVDIKNNKVDLTETKLHHIKNVLRIRENSDINISNGGRLSTRSSKRGSSWIY